MSLRSTTTMQRILVFASFMAAAGCGDAVAPSTPGLTFTVSPSEAFSNSNTLIHYNVQVVNFSRDTVWITSVQRFLRSPDASAGHGGADLDIRIPVAPLGVWSDTSNFVGTQPGWVPGKWRASVKVATTAGLLEASADVTIVP